MNCISFNYSNITFVMQKCVIFSYIHNNNLCISAGQTSSEDTFLHVFEHISIQN